MHLMEEKDVVWLEKELVICMENGSLINRMKEISEKGS